LHPLVAPSLRQLGSLDLTDDVGPHRMTRGHSSQEALIQERMSELRRSGSILTVVSVGCALLALFRFISAYFPTARLWGLNHLAYFPLHFRILITAAGLLVCLPAVRALALRAMERLAAVRIPPNKHLLHLVIAIGSLPIFWFFRSSTALLGDGTLLITELNWGISTATIRKEPLTVFVNLHLFRLLNRFFSWDVETACAVIGCVLGALFIFLVLRSLDFLKVSSAAKWSFFVVIAFMGSSQLFFGYLENYTFHYVTVFAYILLGMRFIKGRRRLILPSLLFLLSFGFHNQAVVLAPSLFFLLLYSLGRRKPNIMRLLTFRNVCIGVIMSLCILGGIYFLKGFDTKGGIFVPLIRPLGSGDLYTLFSGSHVIDVVNQHLLISSSGIILISVLIISSWRRIDWNDPNISFLFLFAFYFLLFNLTIDPELGMARDWDLFAASGVGYTLLGIFLVTKAACQKGFRQHLGVLLAGTAMVAAIPWFLVNASESRSVERFRNLLVLGGERTDYGYEILGIFYREKGMSDGVINALQNAIEINPENPRYYIMLGDAYKAKGLYELAISQHQHAIQMRPNFAPAYVNLGSVFASQRRYEEALRAYRKAAELAPGIPEAYNNIADAYYHMGKYHLAWKNLRIAESLGFEVDPRFIKALERVSDEPK